METRNGRSAMLYCAEHLSEFLNVCERNGGRTQANERERESTAVRMENHVGSALRSVREGDSRTKSHSGNKNQGSLPFAASR